MQPLCLALLRSRWLHDNEMVVAGLSTADSSSALLRPLLLRGDQSLPPPQLSTGYNSVRLREPVRPERGEGSCSPAVMRIGALLAQQYSDGIKKKKKQNKKNPPGHILPFIARVCVCVCLCVCVWGLQRNAPVAYIIARVFFPPRLASHLELTWSSDVEQVLCFFFVFVFVLTWITFESLTRSSEARKRQRERDRERDMENEKYLPELMAEKDTLDPSFQHSLRLLDQGKSPYLNPEVNTWSGVCECAALRSSLTSRCWAAGYMTPPARLLQVINKRVFLWDYLQFPVFLSH